MEAQKQKGPHNHDHVIIYGVVATLLLTLKTLASFIPKLGR